MPEITPIEIGKAKLKLEKHKRRAYLPQVKEVPEVYSNASKFGGLPYLRNENDWPVCPHCKEHMTLLLQLNLNEFIEQVSAELMQLFYCTNLEEECEDELQAYMPGSKGSVVRSIPIMGEALILSDKPKRVFPEKKIISWKSVDDYPDIEEYESLGLADLNDHDFYDELDNDGYTAIFKSKFSGWPNWIQEKEYSNSSGIVDVMSFFFQLDPEEHLPFSFGGGVGHIYQNPANNEFAFSWTCS